jgi:two-component system response regulator AtoC
MLEDLMVEASARILVGEDEEEIRQYLEIALRCQGYSVQLAADGDEVLACLERERNSISAVLLDVVMPRKDGLDALRSIRGTDPELPVIMVSGASSPRTIVDAMKSGATDFLEKPVSHEHLNRAIKHALQDRCTAPPALAYQQPSAAPVRKDVFVGTSPLTREIETTVAQVGWSDAPVLILGETGVGKEVVARRIHSLSKRSDKPLLKLNCAALPSELVESELFGYEKGAFTGAFQRKPGIFELANGGTIFLDEIGDMDFKLQAKLLQVLQDQEFLRVGGKETIHVDVRVIAATHNDLETAARNRTFREDLYYRLNVITIRIPALRERTSEILPLCEFLLDRHAVAGVPVPQITPALREALLLHDWPGNVRELENTIRRLLVLRSPDLVASELRAKASRKVLAEPIHLMSPGNADRPAVREPILAQVTKAKEQAETEAIIAALNSTRWNRKRAAALLKIDYKALLYKMKKLAIDDKMAVMPESELSEP